MVVLASLGWLAAALGGCGEKVADTSDQSTPQAAAASLSYAMQQGDGAAVRRCFVAQSPEQMQYVDALVELLGASRKLKTAAGSRFGGEEAKQLVGSGGMAEDYARRFRDAREAIAGDSATLTASTGQVLDLRKESGKWKVVPGEPQASVAAAATMMSKLAQAMNDLTGEISAGKIKELDQAKRFLVQRGLGL